MVKTCFFDKINDCARWNFAEQVSHCRTGKILVSYRGKNKTVQKNMFHGQRQLAGDALWWVLFSQKESMRYVSMSYAESVNDTFISPR